MNAHIGAGRDSKLVHTVVITAANVADITKMAELLQGQETQVHADAGYIGVEKRQLDRVTRAILRALADGRDLTLLVLALRCSRSTLQTHKQRLARLIRGCLGQDILHQVQEHPCYRNAVNASRERQACRWERQIV